MKTRLSTFFYPFLILFCLPGHCQGDGIGQFSLSSPAFEHCCSIPKKCTHAGANISPELFWEGAPENTKSFVVLCRDTEALPGQEVRWIMYNIPANVTHLPEGIGRIAALQNGAFQGMNDLHRLGYDGPSSQLGCRHYYIFTVYALDDILQLKPAMTYDKLQCMMRSLIIGKASFKGYYRHERKYTDMAPNPFYNATESQDYEIRSFWNVPTTYVTADLEEVDPCQSGEIE